MDYTQFEGHTPGPWEWTGNSLDQKESPYGEVISNEVSCGAYCLGGSWSSHLKDADKALIEAAPALLADNAQLRAENERLYLALKRCVPWMGRLIVDGGHLKCVAPNDAVGALEQAEATLKGGAQ